MHTGQSNRPSLCKPCNTIRAGERHLAKVRHKQATYAAQQADLKANRKAKAKLEVDNLLKGPGNKSSKKSKESLWQKIGAYRDDMEIYKIERSYEL
jgi:ABC-type lipoprotein export system ATPase subunit